MNSRPYFNKSIDELECFVKKDWNSLDPLRAIANELNFRHKQRALKLRRKVENRISELYQIETIQKFFGHGSKKKKETVGKRRGTTLVNRKENLEAKIEKVHTVKEKPKPVFPPYLGGNTNGKDDYQIQKATFAIPKKAETFICWDKLSPISLPPLWETTYVKF